MKCGLIVAATAAVIALGATNTSFAQGVGVQVGPVGAGISFEPAQRTRIKEYVVRERVAPVTVRERITVGATLPADVPAVDAALRALPKSEWPASVR